MDDDNLEENIDDLINQLKNTNKEIKKIPKQEEFTLDKQDLEQFLINNFPFLIKAQSF